MSEQHRKAGKIGADVTNGKLTAAERSKNAKKGGKKTLKRHGKSYFSGIGSLGADARSASLTPTERSEIAKKAVAARESKRKKRKGKK